MDFVELVMDVISVDEVLKRVSSEKCGAVSMFIGTTRDNFDGLKVINLQYEAYEPMAIKVMKKICSDIREKWSDVHNIAIIHRLGTVPVLEASVVIAISSPHRVESLAAVQFCIENLKECNLKDTPGCESIKSISNNDIVTYSKDNVQVTASNDEIERRIRNFTNRKRDQINLSNIQDFIIQKGECKDTDGVSTCARVDTVLVKRKDSKGHLKVMRVQNEWGPQTKLQMDTNKSLPTGINASTITSNGVEERLSNVEIHLNIIKPVSTDVYSRLKKIEERILELESISPEYAMFWNKNASLPDNGACAPQDESSSKKFKFSLDDIKHKIENLQRNSRVDY